jgi:hypothetical protein
MAAQVNRKMGLLMWREMIATLFGLTVLWSGASLATLATLFGVYVLADGLSSLIVRRLNRRDLSHSLGVPLKGVAGIAVGGIACLRPNLTALLPLIAAWAILTGMLDVLTVLRLRNVSERKRQIAWDAMIKRQRQIAWDGAVDRTMRYSRAERMAWDNRSERKMRAERPGGQLYVAPMVDTAQSAGSQQWGQYS